MGVGTNTLQSLTKAEGIKKTTQEDLRPLNRSRKDKKVSNEHWESRTDPDLPCGLL